jgi:hypothetical protein
MSGKHVHPALAEDFSSILNVEQEAKGFLKAMQGVQNFLDWKVISWPTTVWKTSKVSSPSVLVGNLFSNVGMADFNGLGFSKLPLRLGTALKDLKTGGKFSTRAKQLAIDGSFTRYEIMDESLRKFFTKDLDDIMTKKLNLEGALTKLVKGLAYPVKLYRKGFESIYSNSELLFKIGLAQEKMAKGTFKTIDEALMFADRAMINYKDVSKATQLIRRAPVGLPFVTFYQNIIPQILRTVRDNPLKLYKWRAISRTISNVSGASMGYTPEQTNQILTSLGRREGLFLPTHILLPGFSEDGKYRTVDLERWTPTGWLGDTNYRAINSRIPLALAPSGWAADLYTLMFQSIDPVTGNRIPREFAAKEVPIAIGKTFAPPLLSYYIPEIVKLATSDRLKDSERNRLIREKSIQALTAAKYRELSPQDVRRIEHFKLKRKLKEIREFMGRERYKAKSRDEIKRVTTELKEKEKKLVEEFKRRLEILRGR